MERINLYIGTPAYQWKPGQQPQFQNSIQAIAADPRFNVEFRAVIGDAHIERARAMLLLYYLHPDDDKKYDFFLNVDWDIEFRADDVYRMCTMSKELDRPILGGPYSYRSDKEGKGGHVVARLRGGTEKDENFHLPVDYLGGGFTLVREDFMRKLCEANEDTRFTANPDLDEKRRDTYALWNPIIIDRPDWGEGKRELLSEDYSFCERANRLGETCYLDLRTFLVHHHDGNAYKLPAAQEAIDNDGD